MQLSTPDFIVIGLFFVLMLVIGLWSMARNKTAEDYFVASGQLPWWLSGISHHVSGYSGAVFVAYASLAYTHGFSIYVWWAFTIGITVLLSARLFPVLWVRLRKRLQIQSPLEYLTVRYNLLTQQIMAWSGVLLKLFDVGAKWTAIAVLLNVFTGLPLIYGILISGGVSLIYVTFGGLWAVIITDFAQFIVQILAGLIMLIMVVRHLGGWNEILTFWNDLPEGNSQPFNSPYTVGFALAFLCINFLSYNGGTWNLATRYISSPDETQAKRAAYLSGTLYLIWPLILFLPMWAAPLILPDLQDPSQSYGLLTLKLLPAGLVGLVVASLFANTMTMTSSDINTISAVLTRDILPVLSKRLKEKRASLVVARATTFIFTLMTLVVASQNERFGGVFGLIVTWFGALVGPIAVPMLFGMLPVFRHCGSLAAIGSIAAGFVTFIVTKNIEITSLALAVALPLIVSLSVFIGLGLWNRNRPVSEAVSGLLKSLEHEG
ncbi:sodium:solute symporter family protein [Imperialibacter roseus]|uniref:Sodium:solute symporter family protein n=1 Tax=Imperialibacter roseus TaxID=1324217 RepID=A0ABZ0IRZ4_9BACT|nr:sodium:solute symporter family protein [Imperialibacter roseus]WOK06914.1 sodium:solute symporter family protein [Imperialibacter roseus]